MPSKLMSRGYVTPPRVPTNMHSPEGQSAITVIAFALQHTATHITFHYHTLVGRGPQCLSWSDKVKDYINPTLLL